MRRLATAIGLICALQGCRSITLEEFDAMHDQLEARTVLREPGFTLWSPLDSETSAAWARLIERQARAVDAAFGHEFDEDWRLQVVLERVAPPTHSLPAPGESVTVSLHHRGTRNGVLAHASGKNITIFIAPPRRVQLGNGKLGYAEDDPEELTRVLNHELGHVALHRSGVEPPTWLSEGAAELVESLELGPEGLGDIGPQADELRRALALDEADWSLAHLFAWREDGARVESGREAVNTSARSLCGLYVRWVLGLEGRGEPVLDLAARLVELSRRPEAELQAEQAAWLAWREAQLAGAGGAARVMQ